MKQTQNRFVSYICRGKGTDRQGNSFSRRVGAVVGIVSDTTLSIGWSLCNSKTQPIQLRLPNPTAPGVTTFHLQGSPDRFNPELALSLATGRAMTPGAHSVTYNRNSPPTKQQLLMANIPHSTLNTISQLIQEVFQATGKQVQNIVIFSDRPARTPSPSPTLWQVVESK